MSSVWKMNVKNPTTKFVLIALADNANDEGYCYPSIRNLARKTNLSKQSVIDQLRRLKEEGIIESKKAPENIFSNAYLLSGVVNVVDQGGGQRGGPGWSTSLTGVVNRVGHNHHRTITEPSVPPIVPQGGQKDKISDRAKTFAGQFWDRFQGSKPIGVKRISKHLREAECLLASGVSEDQVFRAVDLLRTDDFRRGWVSSLESVATKWPEISGHLNGKLRPIAKMSYKEERSDEEEAWLDYDNRLAMFKAQGGIAPECPSFPRP